MAPDYVKKCTTFDWSPSQKTGTKYENRVPFGTWTYSMIFMKMILNQLDHLPEIPPHGKCVLSSRGTYHSMRQSKASGLMSSRFINLWEINLFLILPLSLYSSREHTQFDDIKIIIIHWEIAEPVVCTSFHQTFDQYVVFWLYTRRQHYWCACLLRCWSIAKARRQR